MVGMIILVKKVKTTQGIFIIQLMFLPVYKYIVMIIYISLLKLIMETLFQKNVQRDISSIVEGHFTYNIQ